MWLLLLLLGIGLVILVIRHEQGAIAGLRNDDFAALLIRGTLLIFISGMVIAMFRNRLPQAFHAALFWLLIGVVLAAGYTYRRELTQIGERIMAEVVPGRAAILQVANPSVELRRASSGEFRVNVQVNGGRLPMILDTGASSIVLTQDSAKAAGLPIEVLKYTINVDTANGRTRAAAVTLDKVSIGPINERAVPALVAQPGQLKTNLLGMSFLNRLESWEVRGDSLVLRGHP